MQPSSIFIIAAALCLRVTTGQGLACNGDCVARWQKCAGEGIPSGSIRPCCSEDDQCVEKTSSFSQCRPKARPIPASWNGAILTCTDPTGCDPTEVAVRLGGLSAGRFASNDAIELDFSYADELDYVGTTCPQACQDNPDCFVYNESVDGECTLFGKNLFTAAGDLQPFFDAEVFLTKCFLPEPLCDPATREVRQVNSIMAADGRPHQIDRFSDFAPFDVTPASYALTAAINVCRLNESDPGRCIGFAIEQSPVGSQVTLLYARGPSTVDFSPDEDAGGPPLVYNIERCP